MWNELWGGWCCVCAKCAMDGESGVLKMAPDPWTRRSRTAAQNCSRLETEVLRPRKNDVHPAWMSFFRFEVGYAKITGVGAVGNRRDEGSNSAYEVADAKIVWS